MFSPNSFFNMEMEKQEDTNDSHMRYFWFSKPHDDTHDAIVISDDEKETLEPKKKIEKQETYKEESQIGYSLLSKQHDNTDVIMVSDDEEEEATFEPARKKKKPMLWSPRDIAGLDNFDDFDAFDTFDELSKVVKGSPETKEDNDFYASLEELWFSPTYLSQKKKEDDKRKYGHVSLDDLGVSVEDLKNIPWEAFDPTWEIRSRTNDPWLGGHIQDMFDLSSK